MRSNHSNMGTPKGSRVTIGSNRSSKRNQVVDTKFVPSLYLPVMMTESNRSSVGMVLGIVNWILVLIAIFLGAMGVYLKSTLQEYTNLVTGYNGDVVVFAMMVLGLILAVTNIAGGFICFQVSNPLNREALYKPMRIYLYVSLVNTLLSIGVAVLCFMSISHLENSFAGGMDRAISAYNENIVIKAELHDLQNRYECCGNTDYTDWFKVQWKESEFSLNFHTNTSKTVEGYFHDDVPYSCCNKFSDRPCINLDIHNNAKHHNYDYKKDLTIYRGGCLTKIMDFYGDFLLINGGSFVMVLFGLQFLTVIIVRFYHTSITQAMDSGNPMADAEGYFFKKMVEQTVTVSDVEEVEETEPIYQEIVSLGSRRSSRHSRRSRQEPQPPHYTQMQYGSYHEPDNEGWHNNSAVAPLVLPPVHQYK